MKLRVTNTRTRAALTLAELLVTIAIMGVLAAIGIPMYSQVTTGSRETVVQDHVENLNKAVIKFSQNCWKPATAGDVSATTDEFLILRSLQYRFPATQMRTGSPYFDSRYNPVASSNTQDFRIRWNGTTFELLKPGTSGTGLRYSGGGDFTTPYAFPSDYAPVAAAAN